jgi:hypothetical protein
MTDEEKAAQAWWLSLSDEELKQLILKSYMQHQELLKELGFKWGVRV